LFWCDIGTQVAVPEARAVDERLSAGFMPPGRRRPRINQRRSSCVLRRCGCPNANQVRYTYQVRPLRIATVPPGQACPRIGPRSVRAERLPAEGAGNGSA